MRGLSKRVRKKIYNDDYESKDVMDILEYIHYGVASLTLWQHLQEFNNLESTKQKDYSF